MKTPTGSTVLEAALNGDREGAGVPRTPEELASEAVAAVRAGADVLHFHPYDEDGRETLAATPCAGALRAVRSAVGPDVALSLSTSAAVEPDPARRSALVAAWTELPDLVSANQGEKGIASLCEDLLGRGVGIEAGLLSVEEALRFAHSDLPRQCVRALVEPLATDEATALADAVEIEAALLTTEYPSRRSITATASLPGRSTVVRSRSGTASGPASRTPTSCPTEG